MFLATTGSFALLVVKSMMLSVCVITFLTVCPECVVWTVTGCHPKEESRCKLQDDGVGTKMTAEDTVLARAAVCLLRLFVLLLLLFLSTTRASFRGSSL